MSTYYVFRTTGGTGFEGPPRVALPRDANQVILPHLSKMRQTVLSYDDKDDKEATGLLLNCSSMGDFDRVGGSLASTSSRGRPSGYRHTSRLHGGTGAHGRTRTARTADIRYWFSCITCSPASMCSSSRTWGTKLGTRTVSRWSRSLGGTGLIKLGVPSRTHGGRISVT